MATVDEITNPDAAIESARGLSLLKDAQKRRSEREANLFMAVPSWSGDLVAEYRVLGDKELDKIADSANKTLTNGKMKTLPLDISLISAACVGLHMVDPESGDRVKIEDDNGHVGYNRIAIVLGREDVIKSNSDAIRYLMGERADNEDGWTDNPTAISSHAQTIARWMRDPTKRSSLMEELLGEL